MEKCYVITRFEDVATVPVTLLAKVGWRGLYVLADVAKLL